MGLKTRHCKEERLSLLLWPPVQGQLQLSVQLYRWKVVTEGVELDLGWNDW